MRKTIFSMLMLAMLSTTGCAADGELHVKGTLKNVGDTLLVVTNLRGNNHQTVVVKDGSFEFAVNLDRVQDFYLVSPAVMQGQRGTQMKLIGLPGESIVLTGDVADRYDITGSKFYKEYHEADLAMEAGQKEMNAFYKKINQEMQQGASQDSLMKVYQQAMPGLRAKAEQAIIDFVKAHPDYEASAAIITNLSPEKMKEGVALLSDAVKNGRMKSYYQAVIDQIEAQQKAEQESARKQAAGVEAPDFTLNDINGKPLALSSLRGKYVILDFWGSWCGWCIKGFPEMKEYYKKYAGKFEILGVDCNDTEQKWKDAVKKNELPWLHVYNPRDSKVLGNYGVQGFPTKIIVGPDGKIVKSIVGEDPAFYTLLDELFK